MSFMKITSILVAVIFSPCLFLSVSAQTAPTPIQCGQILEGEFLGGGNEGIQEYAITLAPGNKLRVSGDTVGAYLQFWINIYAPTTGHVATSDAYGIYRQHEEPVAETEELSEGGIYTVKVGPNGPGLYSLYIGCTLRDGTVIAPGDVLPASHPTEPATVTTELPTNFVGFPGLAPVDMSNAVKLPLIVDTPMTGVVAPASNDVLGFSAEVNVGDTLELDFSRVSGNLNLGVVILSPDNQIVFYGVLILSDSLSTSLIVQNAGEYTIGVYRVDLLPPDTPEATLFQMQGTVAP